VPAAASVAALVAALAAVLLVVEAELPQTQYQPVGKSQDAPVLTTHRCSQEESRLSLGR